MSIIIIWVSFISFISMFQKLDLPYYLLSHFLTLILTCIHDYAKPSQISLKIFFLLSSFPNITICYVTLIYGNFLSVTTFNINTVLDIITIFKCVLVGV